MHTSLLNFIPETYPFPLWEAFLRIVLSALLGALVGFERERRKQPAGLRTHAVLALGSSLITLTSIYITHRYGGFGADPSRITAQIVSGIGFLGAGAILRFGVTVKGLTTAASLWTTAGLGIAVGAGMYLLSFLSALLLLFLLSLVSRVERELIRSKGSVQLKLVLVPSPDWLYRVKGIFEDVRIQKLVRRGDTLEVVLSVPDLGDLPEKLEELLKLKDVKEVEII
ncbi:MAG: MgtC/SapB family protein [Aquificae bacterium]|nr:MgtC/SapB family protein [Aquificota bacterium]